MTAVPTTTSGRRMEQIARTSRGFVYLVSVTGVTGMRKQTETRVADLITQLKGCADRPVAVGFGLSTPEQVRQVYSWGSDGAIVGSAFVKRVAAAAESGASAAAAVGDFCAALRRGLDGS